jgi:diadenylate cyclase
MARISRHSAHRVDLFFVFRLLRETGTWKTVLGVFLAGLFFMAARLLHLRGIQWIYGALSPAIVVILVIIFQPEIRRILERTVSLRKRQLGAGTPALALLVGDIAFKLVERKWGALLVFPGRNAIKPWISEGAALDGLPSAQVIISIFDPHCGGHDGAMVIEDDRISRFSVRLPLSTSGKVSAELGLRHHAAQGLFETTDALIIAVSEERGRVTPFSRGNHEQVGNMLRRILRHLPWKRNGQLA